MKKFTAWVGCFLLLFVLLSFADVSAEESVPLPVLMYHSIHDKNCGKYVLSPQQLEQDIQYLKQKGYTFISCKQLDEYFLKNAPLPKKPVLLTFDDGNYNNYTKAYPVLKKHKAKGVVFAVGTFTEKAEKEKQQSNYYSTLKKNQLKELSTSGVIEIGCHTYGFHQMTSARQGVKKKSGETLSQYRSALSKDFQKFREVMANTGANTAYFAYPFGVYSKETPELLKQNGVRLAFTCNEGINRLTRSSDRYLLKRYNRPSGISSEAFFTQRKIL